MTLWSTGMNQLTNMYILSLGSTLSTGQFWSLSFSVMGLTQYSSRGNHGCDCLQDDVLYSDGFSDIFVDAVVSFASRLVGYFCSYYIYIIPIPPLYNVLCNARNCFTISLWSPWRQGLQQEFSSSSKENSRTKERANFGGRERFGVMRFYCRLQQTNCNYSPQSH